jgi:hypothetical protein
MICLTINFDWTISMERTVILEFFNNNHHKSKTVITHSSSRMKCALILRQNKKPL